MYKSIPEAVITDIHEASAHHSEKDYMIGTKIYDVRYANLSYIEQHFGEEGWMSIYYRTEDGRPGCIFGGRIRTPEHTWEV